jgi:signal transduction histidine kinase
VKIFDKAVLRLTAIFTAILLVVVVGFSVAIYVMSVGDFRAPIKQPSVSTLEDGMFDFRNSYEQQVDSRMSNMRTNLVLRLIYIDIIIVVAGAVGSYFLARAVLKPVKEDAERQSRFVADASHELRTPLAAMKLENEVLLRDAKNATRAELLDEVKSNLDEANKLHVLTNNLLALSTEDKIEVGEVKLYKVVHDWIAGTNSAMTKNGKGRNGRIINNVPKNTTVRTNADALGEVLKILADNAFKYGATRVEICSNGKKLTVADNGDGIASDDLNHIFDRFYRAEKSRTTDGHGLGLALAKNLAEKIGAKIEVKSEPGKGSAFIIEF